MGDWGNTHPGVSHPLPPQSFKHYHFQEEKRNKTKSKVFSLERLYKFFVKKKFKTNFGIEKILGLKENFT